MTYLYVMTFGSFIGYANAFPKLIDDVFGVYRVGELAGEPTGLSSAAYIWIGAGVGALIRTPGRMAFGQSRWSESDPLGYDRHDRFHHCRGVLRTDGRWPLQSRSSTSFPSCWTFIVLFATTGIGNGSTFRNDRGHLRQRQTWPGARLDFGS